MIEDTGNDINTKTWILFTKQVHILFAFMPNMGSFSPDMSPKNLRESIIFSPFLLHLPQLLDKSINISKNFMQLILNLLIFCPAQVIQIIFLENVHSKKLRNDQT